MLRAELELARLSTVVLSSFVTAIPLCLFSTCTILLPRLSVLLFLFYGLDTLLHAVDILSEML